ncbi:hypothetical protein [Streptomyces vietnamensis]|uniref:hypothetical protein n=1 Tax=Streptomyces vietnamensis TaxID=362257 RepID=UPI003429136B
MTLVPQAAANPAEPARPAAPTPAAAPVPAPTAPADAAVPEREPAAEPESVPGPEPVPEPAAESVPEPQAETVRETGAGPFPEPDTEAVPEPDTEAVEAAEAVQDDLAVPGDPGGPAVPSDRPRLRAVPVAPPAGARGDHESPPRREADAPPAAGRPRFGTVSVPEPARIPPARRRDLPAVRAVRLTDEPPAPADRPGPAAVTPVPLPVPRAVPTESRTEEPQP